MEIGDICMMFIYFARPHFCDAGTELRNTGVV